MSWAYYNEFDPKAAAWLRELIKAGHIAPGVLDERSIEDVRPEELRGYGNAINAEVATQFIAVYIDATGNTVA